MDLSGDVVRVRLVGAELEARDAPLASDEHDGHVRLGDA